MGLELVAQKAVVWGSLGVAWMEGVLEGGRGLSFQGFEAAPGWLGVGRGSGLGHRLEGLARVCTDFQALGGDAGAVGGQDILLLFRDIKAGSPCTLAPFFSPQVPSSRPPSSRAPRRPHSPGLRGAHKARQLELKIYAKQLLTDCKGVQLCAGRGWEPALKAQEVAPRPRVKRKTPQWA